MLITDDLAYTPVGREKPPFAYLAAFDLQPKDGAAWRGKGLPEPKFTRPPVGGRDGLDAALVRLAQVTARVITLERAAFGLDERARAAPAAAEGEEDGRSDEDKRRELAALVGAALGAGAPPGA